MTIGTLVIKSIRSSQHRYNKPEEIFIDPLHLPEGFSESELISP
jgi:hypothetical protein